MNTNKAASIRFYHDNLTPTSWELKDEDVEYAFKASTETVDESFLTYTEIPNVHINKCADAKVVDGDAAQPLARLCDPIIGYAMDMCIGASGKSCGMNFKHWGLLLVQGWAEILAQSAVIEEPNAAHVF